jgi:signal transduction histidine kinase
MIESGKSKNDVSLEAFPDGGVPLESILCTEELHRRPWRPPDYEKENRALVALAIALADLPRTILRTLAEKVLEVLQADSAGLSLLTKDEKKFYWAAIAGAWQPHIGGGTPRDFGPCGDVLDRNVPMLFTHWERRYPYLRPATPLAEEGLLVPFYVHGKAVGTIWVIAHNERRKFDAEDLRLLESLGRFASAAYQALASIEDLTFQIAEREKAETALRELTNGLEMQVRVRTEELAHVNRVATLGEMTASIAHEINQPLAAVVNNASACLRWLTAQNLEEARQSAALVVADGHRAGEIVARIRGLAKKAPPRKDWLDINDTIREVIALVRSELHRNSVALETQLSDDVHSVPLILADRIQVQQVLLNLIINAIEAISGSDDGPRELLVRSGTDESRRVLVAVRDSGPGLNPQSLERLFDAFYTTKPHGLGMGLAISRSIIEAHGGRLWATANEGRGATFQFTLPTGGERAS